MKPQSSIGFWFAPYQEGIAVPTMSIRDIGLHEESQADLALERNGIEKPGSLAEATIDFLDSDDVRAYFRNYIDNAIRPDGPVGAPAFVDIIGCDLHNDLDCNVLWMGQGGHPATPTSTLN
jgi:hypothetical protein